MKKSIFAFAAAALIAAASLTSCATVNYGASISNAPVGTKIGEVKSSVILGLWSSMGEDATLKKAAENGGITKINQVEYVKKSYFFGFFVEHTTRVYGE